MKTKNIRFEVYFAHMPPGQSLMKALMLNAGDKRVFLCPVSATKDGGALANWRMEAPLSDRGTKMPFRTQGTVLFTIS